MAAFHAAWGCVFVCWGPTVPAWAAAANAKIVAMATPSVLMDGSRAEFTVFMIDFPFELSLLVRP
jgi:hypothetical protein